MNETLKTIKNRYSCRSFTGEPISKEDMEAIALAAVQSPSGLNQQPWKIIVIQNKVLIDEMNDVLMKILSEKEDRSAYDRMMSRGGKVFYNAPCMYIIAKLPNKDMDCGIVSENMALAATSLGLGNVICGMAGVLLNDPAGQKYKDKLIPERYEFGVALLAGYPTDPNGTPHEPDLSKIIYME